MDENKRLRGEIAEKLAALFLVTNHLKIIAQNVHFGRMGELDIIAEEGNGLERGTVFVEVRSMLYPVIDPTQILSQAKQRKLGFLSRLWLKEHGLDEYRCRWRIDLITVVGLEQNITWYKHVL